MEIAAFLDLPFSLMFVIGILVGLGVETFLQRSEPWALPALVVYATTALWYVVEFLGHATYYYELFPQGTIDAAYLQVAAFLIAFRVLAPELSRRISGRWYEIGKHARMPDFNTAKLFFVLATLWFVLFLIGAYTMKGPFDPVAALFPSGGRQTYRFMWSRGAIGGSTDFLLSAAGYTYTLVVAFLGVLMFFHKNPVYRLVNLVILILAWPHFILLGTRSNFLQVLMPVILTYMLVHRHRPGMKVVVLGVSFYAVSLIMSLIVSYRNVGFKGFMDQMDRGQQVRFEEHRGLNMAEELFYINTFYGDGSLELSYGGRYVSEIVNIIPRAIWPDKPLIGYEYARLRGFGKGETKVVATISTGMVGQGFVNFGPALGPLCSGLLMALWTAVLSRWWAQRSTLPRLCLYMVGLGMTPNLGRDIGLLVLWPVLFGYVLVKFYEVRTAKRQSPSVRTRRAGTPATSEQDGKLLVTTAPAATTQ